MLITASKKRRKRRDVQKLGGPGPYYTFATSFDANEPDEWGSWDKLQDLLVAGK